MVMGSRDSIQSTREGFTFTDKAVAIPMPRYSMLLLEGVARNEVYHCVPYVTLPRISHTYRKMRDSVAARHTLEVSKVGAEQVGAVDGHWPEMAEPHAKRRKRDTQQPYSINTLD